VLDVRLEAADVPLRGSPGYGEGKVGDTRTVALCVPEGYRMLQPRALGETLFEPDEGPTFTDRGLALANLAKPRVRVRVSRSLERETVSESRAREAAADTDRTATLEVHPWGISLRKTMGSFTNVYAFAKLATKPPLAAKCHVGFAVQSGDAAKIAAMVADAERICASLRGE
jgi:hypothetical protein